jgi:hypothetical protein
MGPLPPVGQWVRLEVPASHIGVGLEGRTVSGMSFTLYNGRAAWDYVGKAGASSDSANLTQQLGLTTAASSQFSTNYPCRPSTEVQNSWGRYWKRRPGWTLLTSKGNDFRELMKKFNPYPSMGVHSPTIFVGDGSQNPVSWVALDILDEGGFLLNYLEAQGRGAEGRK